MLPKRIRLGRSEDLRLVIRTGRPARIPGIFIRTRKNNHLVSRYAIAIPKEAQKRATGRNQMRRQLFSAIQKMNSSIREGFDVYITVRKELFPLSRAERIERLASAFQKVGIFKP